MIVGNMEVKICKKVMNMYYADKTHVFKNKSSRNVMIYFLLYICAV